MTTTFNEKSSSMENSSVKIFNILEMRRTGDQMSNIPPECTEVVEIIEKNMHPMPKRRLSCFKSTGREMMYVITGIQPSEILTKTSTSSCDYPRPQKSKAVLLG